MGARLSDIRQWGAPLLSHHRQTLSDNAADLAAGFVFKNSDRTHDQEESYAGGINDLNSSTPPFQWVRSCDSPKWVRICEYPIRRRPDPALPHSNHPRHISDSDNLAISPI